VISKSLNLWKQQLGRVPASVWLTRLHELHLRDNRLPEVPRPLRGLARLSYLDLFPAAVGTLEARGCRILL
jgi:hypothetical protein